MVVRLIVAALVLAALGASSAPARAVAPKPATTLQSLWAVPSVAADEQLMWNMGYMLRNHGDVGYYPDSFFVDLTDEDAGLTHGPRRWTESLTALLSTLTAVSGGDSLQSECFIPARFEKGSLTLRMYGHTGAGMVAPLTTTVIVGPGPVSAAYPAEMLVAGSRAVEIVRMAPGNTEGHAPGVLLVHGEGEHARRQLNTARALHERGYAVVAVSLPGYGLSAGPADLSGPATIAALETAYQALAKTPGVDGAKLAIWGMGRGATAAALLAARHPELGALLLQSGTYDLAAAYRAADAKGRAAIEAEAGRDSTLWRARSPLAVATNIKCGVLLIHGEDDRVAPAESAHAYVSALQVGGATVDARFQSGRGHDISPLFARSSAFQYLRKLYGL